LLPLEQAVGRCLPRLVADELRLVAAYAGDST
jgi:hypothetical protein